MINIPLLGLGRVGDGKGEWDKPFHTPDLAASSQFPRWGPILVKLYNWTVDYLYKEGTTTSSIS